LHVGVLVLRQWADAVVTDRSTKIYQEAVHALTRAARDLAKGQGKPTTLVERAAARANCDRAIGLLRAFDNVPARTKALLGRCQNPRCLRKRPFRVGLEKRLDYCSPTCRVRLSEARTTKPHKQKKRPVSRPRSSR
jgi:hypothetical protein